MKFWTTGRIDIAIDLDLFRFAMLEVEERVNQLTKDKNYGDEIASFDMIVNIFEEVGAEKFKYRPKTKETEIDVNIDHDDFLHADFKKRCLLYLDAIIRSVDGI